MSSLLATKLYRPTTSSKRLQRPHLVQRLNEGLAAGHRLTLVSASAGFGKTTCVSEWVDSLALPVSWLSLDVSDDEPGRFFTYLIAALQKAKTDLGLEIEGILRSGQLPPAESISTTLINDLLEVAGRFVLVLDDFQVIQDRFILQVLEKLSLNLPPALHLVLITREDPSLPLARLRANNQMTEIRAAELRFTPPEAGRFLNELLGLSLSQVDVAELEERTEGWAVGLQLAGLSIRDRANPSAFIAGLSGSHRHILGYLTEEVLNRQPDDIQRFLLQTSILDRLNGDLCDALTERTDSHLVLEQLIHTNLFLIPLGDEQHWYRYHHLFSDSLRNLQYTRHKETVTVLHQRASRWFAGAGMPGEAIQHALAAPDYALAVELIEAHAIDMFMEWRTRTLNSWMQALPPEWAALSPRTNFAFAWVHLQSGNLLQAAPYLERLEAMFSGVPTAHEDPALRAEWLALQMSLLDVQQKPAESLALARQALAIVPEKAIYVRGLIYLGTAGAYRQMGDNENVVAEYQNVIRCGRAAGNLALELQGTVALGLVLIERGQLHGAFELTNQGLDRIARSGTLPPISTALHGEIGQVYYEWYQLEEARQHFQRAIQVGVLSGFSDAEVYYRVILSRMFQMQGDLDASARTIQEAVTLAHSIAPAAVREEVIAQQVRIYLAQDRLTAAEAILAPLGFSFRELLTIPDRVSGTPRSAALLYIAALRILLYRARFSHEPPGLIHALELADSLLTSALQSGYIPTALEILLLRAQINEALGKRQASRADYARALELGEPEGFISLFVAEGVPVADALAHYEADHEQTPYIRRILAAFGGNMSFGTDADRLIESLSKRELEILRLIGEGCSNQEIAARLVITLHTVKKHSSNIYAKLGVNSRTQAVARARQLGLL